MKRRLFSTVLGILLVSAALTGCGGATKSTSYEAPSAYYSYSEEASDSGYYDNGFYAEEKAEAFSEEASTTSEPANDGVKKDSARKLIKNFRLELETESFDECIFDLMARIDFYGGYIESQDVYNGSEYRDYAPLKNAYITARIPANQVDEFVKYVGEAANVTNTSSNVTDVTLTYVDTEAKKDSYEVEKQRLLELLEKAESVEDMLTIEERLSEVRYNIESLTSTLRTYDNLVDYATVHLNIDEVKKYTYVAPESEKYWKRVARSFSNGLDDVFYDVSEFFIGFVGVIPGLVLFLIIVAVIIVIVRAIVKTSKKRREKKNQKIIEETANLKMNKALETAHEKARNNE